MTFNWEEYLKLAKELTGQETPPSIDEAKLRAAISRAYYSAFHSARIYIQRHGGHRPLSQVYGSHESVIKWFLEHHERKYRPIGLKLQNLKDDRVWADYKPQMAKSPTAISFKAAQTLIEAERVIILVNNL